MTAPELRVRDLMTAPVWTVHASHSMPLAASIMELERVRHLPVIDDGGHVVGLVTHRDILAAQISALSPLSRDERSSLQLSVPVSQVMRREVWTIAPDALVASAARLLRDHRFGCLPVVGEGKLVGIVTETDLLALVGVPPVEAGSQRRLLKVEDAMTHFPVTISPATSIAEARSLMEKYRVHHLPVVDGVRPVGIVADRDLRIAEAIYRAHEGASAQLAVALVGNQQVHESAPAATLESVLLDMARLGVGASMVVDRGRLVGVLTTTDACRLFAEHLASHLNRGSP